MDHAPRVQRLKVPAHQGSLAPLRQQVSRWLESQTPTRLGLPADAIVLLRRIQAPASALHPDSPADVLGHRMRLAIRPFAGAPLGTGCDAVWFADEAELLACMARDSLMGQLTQRWWWQTWLGHRPANDDALQAWLRSARRVPEAMTRMPDPAQRLAWAKSLGGTGRLSLLQAMLPHHPIAAAATQWLASALSEPPQSNNLGRPPTGLDDIGQTAPPTAIALTPGSVAPPLRSASGHAPIDGATVLVSLCQLLAESPHSALDEGALSRRLLPFRHPNGADLAVVAHQGASPALGPESPSHAQPVGGLSHASKSARRGPSDGAARPSAFRVEAVPPKVGRPTAEPEANAAHQRRATSATSGWRASAPSASEGAPSMPGGSVQRRATAPAASTRPRASAETAHGGVFFLLNVALAWELYGDFTRPRHATLSVSPWQFLHAAASALLGRGFKADPLAPWLRSQVAFSRPRPWRELGGPPLSLIPSGEARLLQPDPERMATDAPVYLTPMRAANELSCWWPLLRHRLALAMGLPEHEAARTCLTLPARMEQRGDRVDVHFNLHQLPLSVRLAGLDRNPGWVPAAGSDIRFHFEA